MGANLIEQLRQVKDFRTKDGQRHPLWLVLLFVIMGTTRFVCWLSCMGRLCQTASLCIDFNIWNPETWCSIILNNTTNIDGSRF
ncbi:hypothetical protein [Brasilonema bromeliae]|uniref:hypothetical protein n=1 Tax=Brasilonema bromeliae TaxID=383615 RepID=UPI0030DBBFD7